MSPLFTVLVTFVCVAPSLVYNYIHYRKNKQDRAVFILINCMTGLIIFTLYLASVA